MRFPALLVLLVFSTIGGCTPPADPPAPCGLAFLSVEEMAAQRDSATPGAPLTENDITWVFDANVPPDAQAYVAALIADTRDAVRSAVGPPSASITVTVRKVDLPYSAAYDFGNNVLKIGRLPEPPEDAGFNRTFTHETIHAYQDAAFTTQYVSWAAEGIADCATELVRLKLQGRRAFFDPLRILDSMTASYDARSEMGANAVSGGRVFVYSTVYAPLCYATAAAFWWILTCAQGDAASGDWTSHDWLSRFCQHLYASGRTLTQADLLATIAETAPKPVDGRPAREWVEAQPITNVAGPAGRFTWATIANGVAGGIPFPPAQLLFQPFQRYYAGGEAYITRIFSGTVKIRAWDATGVRVWSLEHALADDGWGFQHADLPDAMNATAGAYVIEIDASTVGAGITRLTVVNPPAGYDTSYGAEQGLAVALFNTNTHRPYGPGFVKVDGGTLLWSGSGAFLARPANLERNPSSVTLELGRTGSLGRHTRTVPLPYRRVMKIDVTPNLADGE